MSDQVRQSIVDVLGTMNYDVSGVTAETVLGPAGLDLESLAVAELAMWADDEFGAKFTQDEMGQFATMTVGQFAVEVDRRARPPVVARQGG